MPWASVYMKKAVLLRVVTVRKLVLLHSRQPQSEITVSAFKTLPLVLSPTLFLPSSTSFPSLSFFLPEPAFLFPSYCFTHLLV